MALIPTMCKLNNEGPCKNWSFIRFNRVRVTRPMPELPLTATSDRQIGVHTAILEQDIQIDK